MSKVVLIFKLLKMSQTRLSWTRHFDLFFAVLTYPVFPLSCINRSTLAK